MSEIDFDSLSNELDESVDRYKKTCNRCYYASLVIPILYLAWIILVLVDGDYDNLIATAAEYLLLFDLPPFILCYLLGDLSVPANRIHNGFKPELSKWYWILLIPPLIMVILLITMKDQFDYETAADYYAGIFMFLVPLVVYSILPFIVTRAIKRSYFEFNAIDNEVTNFFINNDLDQILAVLKKSYHGDYCLFQEEWYTVTKSVAITEKYTVPKVRVGKIFDNIYDDDGDRIAQIERQGITGIDYVEKERTIGYKDENHRMSKNTTIKESKDIDELIEEGKKQYFSGDRWGFIKIKLKWRYVTFIMFRERNVIKIEHRLV